MYGVVPSDNPRALTFSAAVNGKVVVTAKGSSALDAAAAETGYTEAGAGDEAPLQIDGHKFALAVGALPQGRNRVTVVTVQMEWVEPAAIEVLLDPIAARVPVPA